MPALGLIRARFRGRAAVRRPGHRRLPACHGGDGRAGERAAGRRGAGPSGRLQPAVHPGRRRRGAGGRPGRHGVGQVRGGPEDLLRAHPQRARRRPGPGHRRRVRPGEYPARGAAGTARRGARRLRVDHDRGGQAPPDGRGGHAGLPDGGRERLGDQAHAGQPVRHRASRPSTASSARPTRCWPGRWWWSPGSGRRAPGSPSGPGASAPSVLVTEVDPVRALDAVMQGFGCCRWPRRRRPARYSSPPPAPAT